MLAVEFEGRKKLDPAPVLFRYVILGVRLAPVEFWKDQYVPASAVDCEGRLITVTGLRKLNKVE
jgi:hypothetical protein